MISLIIIYLLIGFFVGILSLMLESNLTDYWFILFCMFLWPLMFFILIPELLKLIIDSLLEFNYKLRNKSK